MASSTRPPGRPRSSVDAEVFAATLRTIHELGPGDATGEPVFVPRSADAAEGDGWLVSLIYRAAEDRSEFTVFDALDIAAGPVAAAKLPRRVPFGFHGNWRQG